jgi:alkylation response protein AidB-like acyl-CoA dehydrogenase
MRIELTDKQKEDQKEFRTFTEREIIPHADRFDRDERVPDQLIEMLSRHGYLGAILPPEYGGRGMDMITFGLLNEEIGRGCSSVRSLLTVQNMVAHTILKWGTTAQKETWLAKLADGSRIAAFALTEPFVGSDAKSVETTAVRSRGVYTLNGRKKWITYGQIADLILVFAQCDDRPTAYLVEKDRPGITLTPIEGILGTRASMLAEIDLNDCSVPEENLLGSVGFGFLSVASSALDMGRYTVAWGCVGIARACLEASINYSNERKQFGTHLKDHQLIRQMITDMITNVKAARLLCLRAGYLKDAGDPGAVLETLIAKYFSSTMVNKIASDAVQIHGASGVSGERSVERYLRDAKVMEIIEGTSQIHQIIIAKYGFDDMVSPI